MAPFDRGMAIAANNAEQTPGTSLWSTVFKFDDNAAARQPPSSPILSHHAATSARRPSGSQSTSEHSSSRRHCCHRTGLAAACRFSHSLSDGHPALHSLPMRHRVGREPFRSYHCGKNDYICKSQINSKTFSVSKKNTEINFTELINSQNIISE